MGLGMSRSVPWLGTENRFYVYWSDPPFITKDYEAHLQHIEDTNDLSYLVIKAIDEMDAYTQMLRKYGPPRKGNKRT